MLLEANRIPIFELVALFLLFVLAAFVSQLLVVLVVSIKLEIELLVSPLLPLSLMGVLVPLLIIVMLVLLSVATISPTLPRFFAILSITILAGSKAIIRFHLLTSV